jgi:hypothetical protein
VVNGKIFKLEIRNSKLKKEKTMTITDYKNKIKRIIKDEYSYLTDEDLTICMENGLAKLSKDLPKVKQRIISGNDGDTYDLPGNWENGFSYIQAIEYPLDSICPELLEEDDYKLIEEEEILKIKFNNYTIPSNKRFRIYYAIPYKFTDDPVSGNLSNSLINISASLACLLLAEKTSQFQDVSSGLMKTTGISDVYMASAAEYRKLYENLIFNKALDDPSGYSVKGYSGMKKTKISKYEDNMMFH